MGVQIVFGCAYFAGNFTAEQQFAERYASVMPMGIVSLIQLFAAAVSIWYVLGKLGFEGKREKRFLRGYICAFLLTVPCLLQMHTARLVWSPALSCFLWMLGLVMETAVRGVSKKKVLFLTGAYFLYGVICPDGLWLGGILLFFCLLYRRKRERITENRNKSGKEAGEQREKVPFGLAVFFTAAVIFLANAGLNSAFPEARRIYRENNPGTAAVSRFVWPNFASNYFFWDEEVKAVLSEEDAVRLCQRIDLLETEFYPAMVEAYGTGKATRLCLEMGYRCLMDRSRETVLEIGRDLKDHLLIPFTIENNLRGRGVSLTAWNYGRMRARSPVLVKYYVRYGSFELPILLLCSLLLWWFHKNDQMSQWVKQQAENSEKPLFYKYGGGEKISVQWKILFFVVILYTLWYTMRSNLPIDYKLVLPILFIWYLASVGGLLCQKPEN
jgi:hypothetical protein